MRLLVAYDIADTKRLNAVAKLLKDYGTRVQKSIFEIELGKRQFRQLQSRLEKIIDKEVDGVKFYPLCVRCTGKTRIWGPGEIPQLNSDYEIC